jgi:TolB-like protein
MRVFTRYLVAAAVAAMCVCATPGRAGGRAWAQATAKPERPQVAVIRLGFTGGVAEAARELFAQRLVEGLAVAEFQVTSGPAVAGRLAAAGIEARKCTDEDCYRRVAPVLGVAFLVAGSVAESRKTYDITLELVNGRTGAAIGTHRERCEICGVEEAGEKMGLAASALRARLEAVVRAPARFVIRSRPMGAAVSMDGQPLGRTPIDREIAGGTHALLVSAEGYEVSQRTLTAVAGVDETLDLELQPLPSKFPFRAAGITAVAVGAAALIGGIYALSIDGDQIPCAPAEKDPWGACPHLRSTRTLAAALVGLGVGAGTLGGVWLYLGQGRGPREAGAAGGSPTTVAVGVSGRF